MLSKDGTLWYLMVPSMVILVLNVVLFGASVWNLYGGIWSDSGDNKTRIQSVAKMFFATGICWMAEVISWLISYLYQGNLDIVLKVSNLVIKNLF
jgi:hypothetical protein